MRFELLVGIVTVGGALMGGVVPAVFPEETAATERTVSDTAVTVSGAAQKVFHDPSELNPLRWIFDGVQKQITTGASADNSMFKVGTPVPVVTFPTVTPSSQFHFDDSNLQRGQFAGARGTAAWPTH